MDTPLQERIDFFENELIALYQQQKIERLRKTTFNERSREVSHPISGSELEPLKLVVNKVKRPPLDQSRVPENFEFKLRWLRLTDCKVVSGKFHIYFDLVPRLEGYTFVKTIKLDKYKGILDLITRDCWGKTYTKMGSAKKKFLKHRGDYFWADVDKGTHEYYPYKIKAITECVGDLPKGVL